MFKKNNYKIKSEDEDLVALDKELEELINKPIKKEVKQEVKNDLTKYIKKLNEELEQDLKAEQEKEYKNYKRTFKKGVQRPNGTISKSVKSFFEKEAQKLINKNLTIEELIKKYQQKYRKDKSFVYGYLYIEANKDEKGNYYKDYNYINNHRIQYDSNRNKKYAYCLEFNLMIKNSEIDEYQKLRFYNDLDDTKQLIEKFIKKLEKE